MKQFYQALIHIRMNNPKQYEIIKQALVDKRTKATNEAMQADNHTAIFRAQGANKLLSEIIDTFETPEEKLKRLEQ